MARTIQNLEAEMSVLGVAFLNNLEVNKIVEEVSEDMFSDERNKYLFNAIKSLHENKNPIDMRSYFRIYWFMEMHYFDQPIYQNPYFFSSN